MERTIKFSGIDRSDAFNDGSCQEMINWRFRHGAWRPVGPKVVYKPLPLTPMDRVWLHDIENGLIDGEPNWIGWKAQSSATTMAQRMYERVVTLGYSGSMVSFINDMVIFDGTHGENVNSVYLFMTQRGYTGTFQQWISGIPSTPAQNIPSGLYLINPNARTSTLLLELAENLDVRVVFLKRTMIITYGTGMETYLWTSGKQYVKINTLPVADVDISLQTDTSKELTAQGATTAAAVLGNYFTKYNDENKADGSVLGSIMYMAAYRLFDGSFILPSIPKYFQITNSGVLIMFKDPQGNIDTQYAFKFMVDKIKATVKTLYPTDTFEQMKDLVQSVCLFSTQLTPMHRIDEGNFNKEFLDNLNATIPAPGGDLPYKDLFPLNEKFSELNLSESWYLLHEFMFDSLVGKTEVTTEDIDTKDYYKTYATKETLPTDQNSHHSLSAREVFVYNDRLYLYNIKTQFADGYIQFPDLEGYARVADSEGILTVWLKTSMGEVVHSSRINIPRYVEWLQGTPPDQFPDTHITVVDISGPIAAQEAQDMVDAMEANPTEAGYPNYVKGSAQISHDKGTNPTYHVKFFEYYDFDHTTIETYFFMPSVVGYNDARAYKMQLITAIGGYILFEDKLEKNKGMNFSSWHNPYFTNDPTQTEFNYPRRLMVFSELTYIGTEPQEVSTGFDTNRLQASEIQNPIVFPAKYSYQVGTGDGIALMAGSDPLSTGQFGQFPLMAFSTKGIFGLEVGDGEVLHPRIVPINAQVVNNRHNIISIGSGSIVFTTSMGLFLMQGREVTRISEKAEGAIEMSFFNNADYQGAFNYDRFVHLTGSVANTDFLTYIQNSKIGYDHNNEEIIVTNSVYAYSYVFSINNKTWTTVSRSYSLLINAYPRLLAFNSESCVNVSQEDSLFYTDCLIATRPLSFDATDFYKKINRMILRCECSTDSLHVAGVYVFASDDLETWQYVKGIQRSGTKLKDFLLQRSPGSAKFYIVVMAAKLKDDSFIKYLDTDVELRWNTKIR